MKRLLKNIDASPAKRIFLSIIADYNLESALCELIDNAIDNSILNKQTELLKVNLDIDLQRQIITVTDNSGGVRLEDIKLLISPGFSKNSGDDYSIGIFGVGSKRAVIALAEEVRISTRYKKEETVEINYNDEWIKEESWELPIYINSDINSGTTKIELYKLREAIDKNDLFFLERHLSATYALFIHLNKLELILNEKPVKPITFDSWSYPPGFEPKQIITNIKFDGKLPVEVELLGGLTKSGDLSGNEYGVYLYCNDRLIAKAYKEPDVGFRPHKIGYPHATMALARVIIKLKGPPQLMPWNSSKSNINTRHQTFKKLEEQIENLMRHFALLSRKFSSSGGWEETVFKYKIGNVISAKIEDVLSKVFLPPIPRDPIYKFPDAIKKANKALSIAKPWTKGLYEAVIAVYELPKLKLDQNNRISLILLDSTLEIGFKEYLVNDSGALYSESQLASIMKNRSLVHAEIKKTMTFKNDIWKKIEYFYKLRCDLIHKRALANISDEEIQNFMDTTQYVLSKLFRLTFK